LANLSCSSPFEVYAIVLSESCLNVDIVKKKTRKPKNVGMCTFASVASQQRKTLSSWTGHIFSFEGSFSLSHAPRPFLARQGPFSLSSI